MVLHKIFFCLLLFYFLYKNDSPDNGYVLDEQYTVTENKWIMGTNKLVITIFLQYCQTLEISALCHPHQYVSVY